MKAQLKDVVILLPGIMGSALAKGDEAVWDLSAGAVGRAIYTLGDSIQKLALSSDASTGEGVSATHLLSGMHMIPGLWKIDGYSELAEFIQDKFEAVPGENFFEFPYDWRLDNRISAQRLQSVAMEWLENWRSRSDCKDAQLVFIAHSMGGLVSRYFVEVLGGWRHTKMLITLGTPHRGSVKALDYLVNGMRKKVGPITLLDLTDLLRSFPSVHQLLPSYACIGKTEHDLEKLENLPELGGMDMQRARAGVEFHHEIERAVKNNSTDLEYAASAYKLLPVVGTYQPTFLSAIIAGDSVKPIRTYKGKTMLGGDGTVPRLSATPIELSQARAENFVACPHASLQNFNSVRIQVRATLEDVDISEIKAVGVEPISLEMDDVFSSSERFQARARCAIALDPMHAMLTNLDTSQETEAQFEIEAGDEGWQQLDLCPLPAGAYRVHVDAGEEAESISDVFMVLD